MQPTTLATRCTKGTGLVVTRDYRRGRRARRSLAALTLALLVGLWWGSASAQEGERVFQRCYACHSFDPAERGLSGPTLRGIFGRRAGTLDGFDYSQPLREAGRHGLVWSAETLDRFLEDPEALVEGVRMGGVRLRDATERRALIRWLQHAAK